MRPTAMLAALVLLAPWAAQAGEQPTPKVDPNSLIDHPSHGNAGKPSDLTGAWLVKGTMEDHGTPVAQAAPVCEFQQGDRTLSGTCRGPNAAGPASGVVAGTHVSWKWQLSATTAIGATGTAWFQGDVGPDGVMRGTWTLDQLPGLKGDFTGTRR
jgi:hypothetical protein